MVAVIYGAKKIFLTVFYKKLKKSSQKYKKSMNFYKKKRVFLNFATCAIDFYL